MPHLTLVDPRETLTKFPEAFDPDMSFRQARRLVLARRKLIGRIRGQ